ncbi:MAG: ribosome maturation factor RimP [Christensenellales bacterium]
MSKVTERIEAAIENTVQSMGYRIVDVEIGREDDSKVLFVYIDSPQGIGLMIAKRSPRRLIPSLMNWIPFPMPIFCAFPRRGWIGR